MTSAAMFDAAVAGLARGEIDWPSDDIRVMLVTDDWSPMQSSDAVRADLRGVEVAAQGSYRPGGQVLSGREVVRSEFGGVIRLLGGGVEWAGFSGQFRYAVVYQWTGSPDTDRLVAYTDLGRQEASNARVALEYDRDLGVADFTVEAA